MLQITLLYHHYPRKITKILFLILILLWVPQQQKNHFSP